MSAGRGASRRRRPRPRARCRSVLRRCCCCRSRWSTRSAFSLPVLNLAAHVVLRGAAGPARCASLYARDLVQASLATAFMLELIVNIDRDQPARSRC